MLEDQLDRYVSSYPIIERKTSTNTVEFTREGRFDRISQALQPGDWVVIEFGINDAGTLQNGSTSTTGDKGRPSCPGVGNETCTVVFKSVYADTSRFELPD